jgi:hypothetical protein
VPIAAVIIIGDAVEENAQGLGDAATGLPRLFLFQENDNLVGFPGSDGMAVEQVFRRLAHVSKGFYAKFDSSSASQLSGWLRATVAYPTGPRRTVSAHWLAAHQTSPVKKGASASRQVPEGCGSVRSSAKDL